MKLENRSEAALSTVERAKAVLELENPDLIKLKCSNKEIIELNKFYLDQSTWCKWEVPKFVLTVQEMADLRERLLSRIEEAQIEKKPEGG